MFKPKLRFYKGKIKHQITVLKRSKNVLQRKLLNVSLTKKNNQEVDYVYALNKLSTSFLHKFIYEFVYLNMFIKNAKKIEFFKNFLNENIEFFIFRSLNSTSIVTFDELWYFLTFQKNFNSFLIDFVQYLEFAEILPTLSKDEQMSLIISKTLIDKIFLNFGLTGLQRYLLNNFNLEYKEYKWLFFVSIKWFIINSEIVIEPKRLSSLFPFSFYYSLIFYYIISRISSWHVANYIGLKKKFSVVYPIRFFSIIETGNFANINYIKSKHKIINTLNLKEISDVTLFPKILFLIFFLPLKNTFIKNHIESNIMAFLPHNNACSIPDAYYYFIPFIVFVQQYFFMLNVIIFYCFFSIGLFYMQFCIYLDFLVKITQKNQLQRERQTNLLILTGHAIYRHLGSFNVLFLLKRRQFFFPKQKKQIQKGMAFFRIYKKKRKKKRTDTSYMRFFVKPIKKTRHLRAQNEWGEFLKESLYYYPKFYKNSFRKKKRILYVNRTYFQKLKKEVKTLRKIKKVRIYNLRCYSQSYVDMQKYKFADEDYMTLYRQVRL